MEKYILCYKRRERRYIRKKKGEDKDEDGKESIIESKKVEKKVLG